MTRTTNLGKSLALYRVTRGITLQTMALEMSIDAATLSRIERGGQPDTTNLLKLWTWLMRDEGMK